MSAVWKLEVSGPHSEGDCPCCGQTAVQNTGHIYRDEEPFAVYQAIYCNRHPDREIDTLFSVGDWQTSSGQQERVAFHGRVRAAGESYQVMLDDAADSAWAEDAAGIVKLSRVQALGHPSKAKFFESLDEVMLRVPSLNGYLQRCHSGDPTLPLEPNQDAPDVILEIAPELREARSTINRSFAILDESRYFVRCLLPFSVEQYGRWAPSIWVEVSAAENNKITDAWDDPEAYINLCFDGTVATDLSSWGIELELGTKLSLAAQNPNESPRVASVDDEALEARMKSTWAQSEFETFAVERGLL